MSNKSKLGVDLYCIVEQARKTCSSLWVHLHICKCTEKYLEGQGLRLGVSVNEHFVKVLIYGILPGLKKEASALCDSMDGPGEHYAE